MCAFQSFQVVTYIEDKFCVCVSEFPGCYLVRKKFCVLFSEFSSCYLDRKKFCVCVSEFSGFRSVTTETSIVLEHEDALGSFDTYFLRSHSSFTFEGRNTHQDTLPSLLQPVKRKR